MRETWLFLKKVWRFWKVNLTGSGLIALLVLVPIFVRSVAWWAYAGIAAVTFLISCFLTWHDEYKKGLVLAASCSTAQQQLAEAQQRLADEIAGKMSVEEIVLREARSQFRHLTKAHTGTAPRKVMNEAWVRLVSEKHGKTTEEINKAIDRLDGEFHWQD